MNTAILLASSTLALILIVALVREVRLRRAVELDRRRAPVVAAAVTQVGLIIACLAPLALAAYLLYVLRHSSADDEVVTQLLIEQVMADEPTLLLGRPDVSRMPALPSVERDHDAGVEEPPPF